MYILLYLFLTGVNCSNKTCPSCRTKVTKVTDDFRANSLLGVYLTMYPTKARSPAELQDLDAEYKRGDPVNPESSVG